MLVTRSKNAVILSQATTGTTNNPLSDNQIFSPIKEFAGLSIQAGTWLNGEDLGDEGWVVLVKQIITI